MRELKFRAWGINIKEYLKDADGNTNCVYILGDLLKQGNWIFEQYTGLKDKNGKEIYEGDIVNITAIVETDDSDMACIIDTNSIVCWDKEHGRWDINDKPEDEDLDYRRRRYFVFVDSEDRENVEVIGNIHENPESLGGEE